MTTAQFAAVICEAWSINLTNDFDQPPIISVRNGVCQMFHCRWTSADQEYVYDRILGGIAMQSHSLLKVLLDKAMFAVEEAYRQVVIEFAEYWLLARAVQSRRQGV